MQSALSRIISQLRLSSARRLRDRHGSTHLSHLGALRYKHMSSKCRSSSTNGHCCTCSELTPKAIMGTLEHIQWSIPVSRESKLVIGVQVLIYKTRIEESRLATRFSSRNRMCFHVLPGVLCRLKVSAHIGCIWAHGLPLPRRING